MSLTRRPWYSDIIPLVTHAAERARPIRTCARPSAISARRFPTRTGASSTRARAYPDAFVKALTDAGYLAALIPEEYGGSGLGITEAVDHPRGDQPQRRQRRRVPRADVHDGHAAAARLRRAEARVPAEDRERRAAPAGVRRHRADDRLRHDAAEDDGRRARATRYVVRGQKVWISRAEHSDLLLLVVRTTPIEQVKKRTEGLSVLLVDLREAVGHGLTIRPIRTMMNHATTELFFDDLEVPVDTLVGEEGKGFRYLLDGLNAERILIAAECVGDGRWFIERATQYAKERVVFGRPIGQNQGVQFPIARAHVNVEAADLMRIQAAELFDRGEPCGAEANMAKLLAADASWEAANVAVQTYGGFGFAEDYDIERKFRETRLYQVAPISTNLILAYVAEHVLGLPRSY